MDLPPSPYLLGDADTHDHAETHDDASADAALAALRAAMGADSVADAEHSRAIDPSLDEALRALHAPDTLVGALGRDADTSTGADVPSTSQQATLTNAERASAVSLLNHLQQANTALLSSMNLTAVLEGLMANVKTLTENQQKQGDIIRALVTGQSVLNTTGMPIKQSIATCSMLMFRDRQRGSS